MIDLINNSAHFYSIFENKNNIQLSLSLMTLACSVAAFVKKSKLFLCASIAMGSLALLSITQSDHKNIYQIFFNKLFSSPIEPLAKKESYASYSSSELFAILMEKNPSIDYMDDALCHHRFSDVKCAKKTVLSIEGRYFHGNSIQFDGKTFIASQAPIAGVDAELFWSIAQSQKDVIILDLTNENDKIAPYYPESGKEILFETSLVKHIHREDSHKDLAIHTYEIKKSEEATGQTIQRANFSAWPDHGTIDVGTLGELVDSINKQFSDKTVWVHCRAGVGRTGTVIAACLLKDQIEKEKVSMDTLNDTLVEIILSMRAQRNHLMVQTPGQLELLMQYGNYLLKQ